MFSQSTGLGAVSSLRAASAGCLQQLECQILSRQIDIEQWFREKWQKASPPIYGSIDLRNAEFKLSPVDMNLFPAGFNNLNPDFMPLCVEAIQDVLRRCDPSAVKILLIPENHTRNLFYLESLSTLQEIILNAGYAVRIGSLIPELTEPKYIKLPSGRELVLNPLERKENKLFVGDFEPCVILLNNDLSSGIPDILQGIEQNIRPPMHLGWSQRLKSNHFFYYQQIADEFAKFLGIDSWLINPLFTQVSGVDFLKKEGIQSLTEAAEMLLYDINKKYREYKINQVSFLMVKANSGTYGMSVMAVHNAQELKNLNRKQRAHMASAKGGGKVERVILQEGVYTFETVGLEKAVAEPVIYTIGRHVVGGFYRVHKKRGTAENLNSPGMFFEPLSFTHNCNAPDKCLSPTSCVNRFYIYGVIARLSLLAAANEIKEKV